MRNPFARNKRNLQLAVTAIAALLLASPAFPNAIPRERVIDLEGTTNTRDIGGYQTTDQRILRTEQIIRSENLSRLTAGDFRKLEEIGVKTVIDLRSKQEHEHKPTVWQGDNPPEFHHFPVGDARNPWFKAQQRLMSQRRFTEEQALDHMVEGYRMIAEDGPASYEKLMEVVLDESNWPVLIHCNAGKDRAGIAVALILEAVGVDRETIMEEYLLTNEIGRSQKKAELLARESRRNSRGTARTTPASAWYPIVGVQADMLEAFYASVDEEYGSMDAFLAEIGVDSEARSALRASLTTEVPELAMAGSNAPGPGTQ